MSQIFPDFGKLSQVVERCLAGVVDMLLYIEMLVDDNSNIANRVSLSLISLSIMCWRWRRAWRNSFLLRFPLALEAGLFFPREW